MAHKMEAAIAADCVRWAHVLGSSMWMSLMRRKDEAHKTKTRANSSGRLGVMQQHHLLLLMMIRFFKVRVLRSTVASRRPCPNLWRHAKATAIDKRR